MAHVLFSHSVCCDLDLMLDFRELELAPFIVGLVEYVICPKNIGAENTASVLSWSWKSSDADSEQRALLFPQRQDWRQCQDFPQNELGSRLFRLVYLRPQFLVARSLNCTFLLVHDTDLSALSGSQSGLRQICSLSWVGGSESGF